MKYFQQILLFLIVATSLASIRCNLERIEPIANTFKKIIDLKGVTIEDIYALYQRSDGNYAILVRLSGLTGIPASGIIDKNGSLIGDFTPFPSIEGNVKDAISDNKDGFILVGGRFARPHTVCRSNL